MSRPTIRGAMASVSTLMRRGQRLCVALEHGAAALFRRAIPAVVGLLRAWLGDDTSQWRARHLHRHQRHPSREVIVDYEAPPCLQVDAVTLASAVDNPVRGPVMAEPFDRFGEEGGRLLLPQPVIDHVARTFMLALERGQPCRAAAAAQIEVRRGRPSGNSGPMLRESTSPEGGKGVYIRRAWPSRSDGLERGFMEWARADASIEACCKLGEHRHGFVRMRYVKDEGLPAFHFPDFLVRTATDIYMVETGLHRAMPSDGRRKPTAAVTWCERINGLAPHDRGGRTWHYVVLGEHLFRDWQCNGAHMAQLLELLDGGVAGSHADTSAPSSFRRGTQTGASAPSPSGRGLG